MLYQPGKTPHNLPFDPFKACIVPRPIGWISTTSPLPAATPSNPHPSSPSHNLAPFSQFAQLTFDPPYVLFSSNQNPHASSESRKDTVRNVEATGKFAWNLATYDLREEVNITAQQLPPGEDEFVAAGLEKEFTTLLPGDESNPVPMVKRSPVRFECVYHSTLRIPGDGPVGTVDVVIGRVVGVHIAEWALNGRGRLDVRKTRPIARLGYYEYAVVGGEGTVFEMVIPGADEVLLAGLEGSRARVERWVKGEGKGKAKL
jgi:flavin reductase (DIM6/NTAB) family NADH-FMN oxidoreductase RutF